MRIAILGRTHWLLDSAMALLDAGHNIALVATAAPAPEYRVGPEAFEALAQSTAAPFHNAIDANGEAFRAALRACRAELVVSVNWPTVLRAETCATPPRGILNAHAGDLPRFRGNACPNWAILLGEQHLGVCVHAMTPGEVDAGPIYARARRSISDQDYIADLYRWLDQTIPGLFVEAVANTTDPAFRPVDQDSLGARPLRCLPRRPEDGEIDWRRSAIEIARLVRASSRPFAGAFSWIDGHDRVTIWRARPIALDYDIAAVAGQICGTLNNGVLIACGEGTLLIEEAERQSGADMVRSRRVRLGRAPTAT